MKFEILDNLIPKNFSDEIEDVFLNQLPWYYFDDVTYANTRLKDNTIKKSPGFNHEFYNIDKNGVNSEFFSIAEKIPNFVFEKYSLLKCRAFFQIPTIEPKLHNNPHVDFSFEHTVLLYYVNDSDGDTFMFDDNEKMAARISPKKGRVLLFDGIIKHSSSQPKTNNRIIINYGFKNDCQRQK